MPAGQVLIGFLAVSLDPNTLLIYSGLAYALLALATLSIRDVRRLTAIGLETEAAQ
jgi:hypothetical protein